MKVLVVGYGSIGKKHIENLSSFHGIEILVCTKRKPDKFLKKKKCVVFLKLDDSIKQKPDFAVICNKTNLHLQTALKLAKSGINLFIEKPLSHNLTNINVLTDTIKQKKLVSNVSCPLRFHPCIKKIKDLIKQQKIGRIISARVENGSYLPYWHPYEDYKKSYASNQNLGGGVVLTNIHELDYLYWFFGKINEVFSITGKFSDLDIHAEDLSVGFIKFSNRIIAEYHLDFFQHPNFRSCKIIGTRGTIYWNSISNTVTLYDIKKKKWNDILTLQNYDNNKMYVDEILHFIDCVKNHKKSINPVKENTQILKTAISLKNSAKIKKTVKI